MLIADAKRLVSIEDVITSAGVMLYERGSRMVGSCPMHDERTPSFFVFPDKQRFRCFGCGEGGDVIDFVRKYYHVDLKGALKHLGINSDPAKLTPQERKTIARAREKRELRLARAAWRSAMIDKLSLYIRCAYWILGDVKTEEDLERCGFLYGSLTTWEYQLDILLNGFDWQKYEFLKNNLPKETKGIGRSPYL